MKLKKQEAGFLGMLLGTLNNSSLGNTLTGKGVMRAEKSFVKAGIGYNNMDINFQVSCIRITKYSNYQPRFNGVYSKDNLPRIKDRTYVIDDKQNKETYWFSLFIEKNTAVYFRCFGIEYSPQEVLNKIKDKCITHNICRIQSDNSTKC